MILGGDIGGTKTVLGLFQAGDRRPELLRTARGDSVSANATGVRAGAGAGCCPAAGCVPLLIATCGWDWRPDVRSHTLTAAIRMSDAATASQTR